jgi:hypothetical protein
MSKLSKRILSVAAVSLTLGAAQFALGRDLSGRAQQDVAGTAEAVVNRAGKADRAERVAAPAVQSRTISLQPHGLAATSVLVRIPLADAVRSPTRSLIKSGNGRTAVACEPAVSVLTEVAKQLEPGRCVT